MSAIRPAGKLIVDSIAMARLAALASQHILGHVRRRRRSAADPWMRPETAA